MSDGDDMVCVSFVKPGLPVGDRLKWFQGRLQFSQKFLRNLDADGVLDTVRISSRGRRLSIKPEAPLRAHQPHLRTDIEFRS